MDAVQRYSSGKKHISDLGSYWPKHVEMWTGINDVTKYVLSMSLNHSDWQNSVFLNHVDEVRKLKPSEGGEIKVHGSAHLA